MSQCTHPSGVHSYHSVENYQVDDQEWMHIDCGYCGQDVKTIRIK